MLKNNPQAPAIEDNGNLVALFAVDVKSRTGNSPIIKYDARQNQISSFKARYMFEDYQTFFAKGNLYAFKNGPEFHVLMIEDAASI